MLAALVSGVIAIHGLLRFLRTRSLDVFVWYRIGLAAVVLIVWLS
jgi:undecaprenyl pyrophosphate phosphatase UppP